MWKMFDEEPNLSGFDLDFPKLCEPPTLARQQRDMMPHLRSHAVNSPLEQLAIGRELNSYTGPRYPETPGSGRLSQAHGHAGGTAVCYR
jgi:hypothetical protein